MAARSRRRATTANCGRWCSSSAPSRHTAPGLQQLLADAEAGRLNQSLKTSADDLAALRRQGRAYNKAVSLPLFRYYVTQDLAGFENDYRAFAARLARLQ